jgi:hypothetical protein
VLSCRRCGRHRDGEAAGDQHKLEVVRVDRWPMMVMMGLPCCGAKMAEDGEICC